MDRKGPGSRLNPEGSFSFGDGNLLWNFLSERPFFTAVAGTLIAGLLRWSLDPWLSGTAQYVPFFAASAYAATAAGVMAGLLAVVLGGAVGFLFFVWLPGIIDPFGVTALAQLGLYLITAALIVVLIEWGNRYRKRIIEEAKTIRRQAALIDLSPDAIIVRLCDGTIKFWSKGAERLYGWSKKEALEKNTDAVLHTRFPEPLAVILERIERGEHWSGELVHTAKDGRTIIVQSYWRAETVEGQTEILESNVDISDRKKAEEALRDSEQRLRRFYESGLLGVIYWNMKGEITDANDKFLEMTGYTRQELRDGLLDWTRMTPPEYAGLDEISARELESAGVGTPFEKEYIRKDGSRIPILIGAAMLDRARFKGVAFVLDITVQKRLEAELRAAATSADRAKAAAEQANQAKDQFLAMLSHELRTPLTPVLSALALLKRTEPLSPNALHHLEIIKRNVSVEARLIDDLLDLTRIVRGKVSLEKEAVDVCDVLAQVAEVCLPDVETKQLHFALTVRERPLPVYGDPSRLQQVLWNLIKNSIKFTPEGGCVGVQAFGDDHSVVLEVGDSGVGIDEEALPRIFDAFEQGDKRITKQFGGLGLGLAISKRLVEMHEGTISAHSAGKGRGALFRVVLPRSERAGLEERAEREQPVPAIVRSAQILLVEDHGDTAQMTRALLESLGYEVQVVGDVAEALRAASSREFDLLISDLGLPDRSGLDLMRELRRQGRELKGIALSGFGREEDVRRSKEAGFLEHITKPVDFDLLERVVERAIASRPPPSLNDAQWRISGRHIH